MPELADIFRRYGREYLDAFGQSMLPSHHRAFRDILQCRSPVLGGQVYRCDACGREHFVYHSCRNRSCPKCHGRDTRAWLEHRKSELLPVHYFHVVFTVPSALRRIIRRRQKQLYPLLMKAAAKALVKLAADPHYVGGLIGVLTVLHTWTRTLEYHPHVHCLVAGGGLTADGQWREARSNYLVPVKALSRIFRGIFLEHAAKQLPPGLLPSSLRRQPWVVYAKPSFRAPDRVLEYLGRYVHRIAITNNRILAIDDGKVTFRYRRPDDSQWRTMTLGANEFLRRFLQHVLPKGIHKVRYYGLWAPSNRPRLRQIQIALAGHPSAKPPQEYQPATGPLALSPPSPPTAHRGTPCPYCHSGTLIPVRRIPPLRRAPP